MDRQQGFFEGRNFQQPKQEEMQMLINETQNNVDKIRLYNWSLLDEPGTFMQIKKTLLRIDHSYQRKPSERDEKILRIASNWSWIGCGVLLVANRDKTYFVMDGQHRTMAAMKRSDITYLPCMVFRSEDSRSEAEGFLRANTERKPMKSIDRYRARLKAGEPNAVFMQAMIDQYNLTVSDTNAINHFGAPAVLLALVEKDRDLACRVFDLSYKLSVPNMIHSDFLKGFADLDGRLVNCNVNSRRFVDRALSVGREAILKNINSAKAFRGAGGGKVIAEGILLAMNHRLKHKIEAKF